VNAANFAAARDRLTQLYGAPPGELFREVETASALTPALAASIRPDDAGAADRAERFAEHCDALRRQALLLGQRVRLANSA
jgi:hypothetical protein